MNTFIFRYRGRGAGISTTQENYIRLSKEALKGCPFEKYSAWDLLQDLIYIYSWMIPYGESVPLEKFLEETRDSKAIVYKNVLLGI